MTIVNQNEPVADTPIDLVTTAPASDSKTRFIAPASSSMIPEARTVGFFSFKPAISVVISTRLTPQP